MTREEAARILDPETSRDELWKYDADTRLDACNEACRMGADALREQQEQENPEPLTLDELRQMDGEPVWLHTFSPVKKKTNISQWAILESIGNSDAVFLKGGNSRYITKRFCDYGTTWLAYRNKPKDG